MSLNKKLTLRFLVLFFVFCLFFQPCSADDILNITISNFEPTLEVLQGKCNAAPFHITNRYTETVHIYYRVDSPSDMDITSYPKDYTQLAPGATVAGNLNVCVNEYFENDTYNIKFWLETLTKVNESRVRSDKRTLGVVVQHNPEITTTTSTISETTTTISETTLISSQTISTIPTTPATTTVLRSPVTTTMEGFDISMPKIGNLPGGEKLSTVGVIIIASILIMIPYITFIKGRKAKVKGS